MSTLNRLGQERTVCPEAKIVERPFLAKGTAKVRAESGKRRARFRTEEGSLEHMGCIKGGGNVSLEREAEAS